MHFKDYLKATFMLAGSFAIGYNAAAALHEMGHALAALLTGASCVHIEIHPFSRSFTWYEGYPLCPRAVTWAGVVLGSTSGVLLFLIGWRWRSPWLIPLVVTAICALIVNGLYLGIDAILQGKGDGTTLVDSGAPMWLVVSISVILLVMGLVCGIMLIPRLGVSANTSIGERFAILAVGIGVYLATMFGFQWKYNPDEIGLWSTYVVAGFLLLGAVAFLSHLFGSQWQRIKHRPVIPPDWVSASVVLALGITVVFVLLVGWHQ